MSYRALLFCPDEAAARLVTQILSELEFTVELSFEPFVTVQKLTAESFDAVVVDCANEENASLLFKGARNSSLNHSSLCVAVVEGQMGVAKAFRIGANLVLTKPINIEQSKGTLRVARGLLRKGENKSQPATGPAGASHSPIPVVKPTIAAQPAPTTAPMPVPTASLEPPASLKPAAAVPTSLFEAEQDKQAASGADDAKLQSPVLVTQKPPVAEATSVLGTKSTPDRFAGGIPTGAAAAPAMATEKLASPAISTPPSDSETHRVARIQTAAPLATQEAIIPDKRFAEPEAVQVPALPSFAKPASAPSGAGSKVIWTIVCLLVLGPAGFFGWRKLQVLRNSHRAAAINAEPATSPAQPIAAGTSTVIAPSATEPQAGAGAVSAPDTGHDSAAPIIANGAPEGFPTKETISVEQPSDTPEPAITVVAKPEPLQVKQKPVTSVEPVQAQPTPPSIVLPDSKATDSTLAGIVTTNVAVPKPAPGALQVSEGVTQGLLIKKIAPAYPSTALKLRKQGAVKLLATVSKTGVIAKLRVMSGDSMLADAAVDAVRQWKYRPFLLNAEPVEIETQITIIFKLPN